MEENIEMMKVISAFLGFTYNILPPKKNNTISQYFSSFRFAKGICASLNKFSIVDENVSLHKPFIIDYKYIISLLLTIFGNPHIYII